MALPGQRMGQGRQAFVNGGRKFVLFGADGRAALNAEA